ncbi:hypothetical protein N9L24_03660, partial [Candidatus Marinamargulisbacteria bacterium]|nr:hypothetical protein [Candidatus Marinamargulisbacteria bacterium]
SEVGRHEYGLDCGFSAFEQTRALLEAYQGSVNLWRLKLFFLPFNLKFYIMNLKLNKGQLMEL